MWVFSLEFKCLGYSGVFIDGKERKRGNGLVGCGYVLGKRVFFWKRGIY